MLNSFVDGPLLRPFILCAVVCALILWVLLKTGLAWSLATDVPTHRSLHSRPTPRVGGWGVAPASALGLALFAPQLGAVAVLVLVLAAICQIDDRRGLSARVRFAAQLGVVVVLCAIYRVPVVWWLYPVLVVGLIWVINLYNFMDGADGLAGGMALIGFGAYAIAAVVSAPNLAAGAAGVGGAAAGFLLFNWPPARLFMGDAGSIPLGFLVGAIGVIGWSAGVWPVWFPFMVFAPFILDATVTLTRRLLRGERFWEAHREHYYQRMIQMDVGEGNTHGNTIRAWYVLMVAGAFFALLLLETSRSFGMSAAGTAGRGEYFSQYAVVVGCVAWFGVLFLLAARVDRQWAQHRRKDHDI